MRYENILETIGHTPIVELKSFSPRPGVQIFAKLEGLNPSGSIKDRIAKKMIEQAESQHLLTSHSMLLEPTSGNTGVALALVAGMKGYPFTAVVPETITSEKRAMLELYDAYIVTAPGASGSNGAVMLAREMVRQDSRYVMVYQYGNEANAIAHYETTAMEILKDVPDVNVCVAGLGTGGTLTGLGWRLKARSSAIHVVAAEPMQGDGIPGLRNLADGFVPPVLDQSILDARLLVSSQDAWERTLQLKVQEGIFAGPSSGAVLEVALRVAASMYRGKIVVILADGGWKYMSESHWMLKDAAPVLGVPTEPLLAV